MKFINTVEAETAQQKYWAALNASTTSYAYRSQFDRKTQLMLERAELMLSMLHYDSKTKINYRKTLASIKVFNKNIRDIAEHRKYVEYLKSNGWVEKNTPQGLIYSVKKTALAA